MTGWMLGIGILIVLFVGYNIGGSTTGPAFGPAIGADAISKTTAAALMSGFFFLGAWTLGHRVVDTLGTDLVIDQSVFTLRASLAVLFFIGFALFCGNVFGVPASTSMTAVGAIAGLGLAGDALNWAVMGEIVIWWIVAPAIGFWISLIVGRYFYAYLHRLIAMERSSTGPISVRYRRGFPVPSINPEATTTEVLGVFIVVLIGCLMAYSSGASNIANAVAPLVGSGDLEMTTALLLGSAAVGIGTFTIARKTLETMGNDLTDLPLTAAVVVATISAGLVIFLSAIGIPASFVVVATLCIIGLGWGRATRPVTLTGAVTGGQSGSLSIDALTIDEPGEDVPAIGEETVSEVPAAAELFQPGTTGRVILMQNLVPVIATVCSYVAFRYLPFFGL